MAGSAERLSWLVPWGGEVGGVGIFAAPVREILQFDLGTAKEDARWRVNLYVNLPSSKG